MMTTSTMPATIEAAGSRRRGESVLARMLAAPIELRIGLLSEPRSGLVGLGSRRWVVIFWTRSSKASVGSSEEFSELPDVTVAPHCRQKFASGSSSAPHAEHRGTLIRRQNTAGICFGQASPCQHRSVGTGSGSDLVGRASFQVLSDVAYGLGSCFCVECRAADQVEPLPVLTAGLIVGPAPFVIHRATSR